MQRFAPIDTQQGIAMTSQLLHLTQTPARSARALWRQLPVLALLVLPMLGFAGEHAGQMSFEEASRRNDAWLSYAAQLNHGATWSGPRSHRGDERPATGANQGVSPPEESVGSVLEPTPINSPVPEPSIYVLMLAGMGIVLVVAKRLRGR